MICTYAFLRTCNPDTVSMKEMIQGREEWKVIQDCVVGTALASASGCVVEKSLLYPFVFGDHFPYSALFNKPSLHREYNEKAFWSLSSVLVSICIVCSIEGDGLPHQPTLRVGRIHPLSSGGDSWWKPQQSGPGQQSAEPESTCSRLAIVAARAQQKAVEKG